MQFDFNVVANGGQQIDVKGRFFKYISGLGKIRVTTSAGRPVDLLPGQGLFGEDFSWLNVKDRSGAANTGIILAGDFDFRDDRISGTVDVVDGGKSRTLAGKAFAYGLNMTSTVDTFASLQLFNLAGSGKNLFVEQMLFHQSVAGVLAIYITTMSLPTDTGIFSSSKLGGAVVSTAAKYFSSGTVSGGAQGGSLSLAAEYPAANLKRLAIVPVLANQQMSYRPIEPLVLPPGFGIAINSSMNSAGLWLNTEHFEE